MEQVKRHAGYVVGIDGDSALAGNVVARSAVGLAPRAPSLAPLAVRAAIVPTVPSGIVERQLDGYGYNGTSAGSGSGTVAPVRYGSNIPAAWRFTTGLGVTVALVDDGFDPATTATYGNFSTALSRAFGTSSATSIGEPSGGYHGTTTSGLIGATGANNMPEGVAPNASLVGVKVGFGTATLQAFAQAEQYAASVSAVVNNSWGFTGYGTGEPNDPSFTIWYSTIQSAVGSGRGGLGTVLVFAAGNDRQGANNLAVQPVTGDYRVIAVAATDENGTVAPYSTAGSALLVSAIGDAVAVAIPGGAGNATVSGTSYSSPTVAAITALMLSVNPALGWRDVQEILADSAYAPAPASAGFTMNGARGWNGGGMHFSNDMGYGVVDAYVAVNLARAWAEQSTSANLASATVSHMAPFSVGINATARSTVADTANIRIQHVQVTLTDTYLPGAWSKLTLIAPDGTASVLLNQVGLVGGLDQSGGLDVSGTTLTTNAFWGQNAVGTWTLQVQDIKGNTVGTIQNWSLIFLGDNAATSHAPLAYTPEFAALAATTASRAVVTPGGATTIDLIALPATTSINLNGGAGLIDGVSVRVGTGLRNANAEGCTGSVSLTGLAAGGSELTGGELQSSLAGYGGDTINAGLGASTISTGAGGSTVSFSSLGPSAVTMTSGGGDTIHAGVATATITVTGGKGDIVYQQSGRLTFINGAGASTVTAGGGTVLVQAGLGGGIYYAGTSGNSQLTAGTGLVSFFGAASGDVLTAAGASADRLVAGAGTETLSGGTSTGSIVLQAGSGADTMVAGHGRTTFILGSGDSAITAGGQASMVQIQFGHVGGADTVAGFRIGTDDLHLLGFSSSAVNAAVGGERSDGRGGALLTFADNTRIDLLGVSRVTSAAFG